MSSQDPTAPARGEPGGEIPPQIPDHELLRRVGSGSYGEIWLARSVLGTYRAIKIVYRRHFEDDSPYEREFRGMKKFEPVSRSHDGFVHLLHVGRDDRAGYFYYVMELADDDNEGTTATNTAARASEPAPDNGPSIDPIHYAPKTLKSVLARSGNLDVTHCVELGLALSSALTYLHAHKLIHRDLKPANIIFVNGKAKIADIGLVAELGSSKSFVGTEGFIAPEGPGHAPGDLFSLGKLLYEASTGLDRRNFPVLPDDWANTHTNSKWLELNEVILKACENDLSKRYKSAEDLHSDLEFLHGGKSVKRLRALERRLALMSKMLIATGIALLLAAVAYYLVARAEKLTKRRLAQSYVTYANRSVNENDLFGSLPWYAEALDLEKGDAQQEKRYRIHLSLTLRQCPKLTRTWFHPTEAQSVDFSPDNRKLVSAGSDGTAIVWDVESNRKVFSLEGHQAVVMGASFSYDSNFVVTASWDGTAKIWQAQEGRNVQTLLHPALVNSSEFHPTNSNLVLTGARDGRARLWDWPTSSCIMEFTNVHTRAIRSARFSPNGRRIVTASEDGTAQVWDVETGLHLGETMVHGNWVYEAVFSPDGTYVATASFNNKATLWEADTGREVWNWEHEAAVGSVAFSPDGRYLAAGCWDLATRVWNIQTRKMVGPPIKHSSQVRSLSFDSSGRRLAAATTDGTLSLWDLSPIHGRPPTVTVHYSEDNQHFVTTTNQQLQVWDAATTQALTAPINLAYPLHELKLNHDASRLLALTRRSVSGTQVDVSAQVWDTSGKQPKSVGPPFDLSQPDKPSKIRSCMSRDGLMFAHFSERVDPVWTGMVWNAASAQLLHSIHSNTRIRAASFDPSGRYLAFGNGSGVELWEPATRAPARLLPHDSQVEYLEFSHAGRLLLTACSDDSLHERAAQIWEVRTATKFGPPLLHRDGVSFASFSPDDRQIVTASEDNTVQVWNVSDGRRLLAPFVHKFQVYFAAFSPDGRWIGTGSRDWTARIWDARLGVPITPPLRHPRSVEHVQFIGHGPFVITSQIRDSKSGQQTRWLWDLSPEIRPVRDLMKLAQLLSSRTIEPMRGTMALNQQEVPLTKSEVEDLWSFLQREYPADFLVTQAEKVNWHEREQENSEMEGKWRAALFHLHRLLELKPNDPTYRQAYQRVLKEIDRSP